MAKKANSTPAVDASEVTETEATTSAVIDQPAVSDDASASSPSPVVEPAVEPPSSPADPAIVEPVAEPTVEPVAEPTAGGGFTSPFVEPPSALTMVQRIELLEARVAALEAK
jgi:hypothetical protein